VKAGQFARGAVMPMAIWCLLVLTGVIILSLKSTRSGPTNPVSGRFLPNNTLVLTGDVAQDGITGRYVRAANGINQGTVLRSEAFADAPEIPITDAAQFLLSVPVSRKEVSSGVNAGGSFQLCSKVPAALSPATVVWVRCDRNGPDARCSALVQLPFSELAGFAAKGINSDSAAQDLHLAKACG
jgi:hypothetical protein